MTFLQKKVDQYYQELLRGFDFYINEIKQAEMTPQEMQVKKLDIYNKVYIIPKFSVGQENKEVLTNDVSISEASSLIGNGFSFSPSQNSCTITQLRYTIAYTGGTNSLLVTENFNKRSYRGYLTNSNIVLVHHFQGNDVISNGPAFKKQKEDFLASLIENNKDVVNYLEAKKQSFLNHIELKIQNQLDVNQKKIDDLNSF